MVLLIAMQTDRASATVRQAHTAMPLLRRALEWGAACIRRSRERGELRRLPLRDRQDLGHNRVNSEVGKRFWRR